MVRAFRQQIDEGILDRAAALFARRGFAKTSVQDIADAVGLSKAGLLHHFPSKDALHDAVRAEAGTLGQRLLDQVGGLPLGVDRDRRAIDAMVDVALAHPGMVSLLLSPVLQGDAVASEPDAAGVAALRAFGVDPAAAVSERTVRVAGALAALAVLTLSAHHHRQTTEWRPHIVATCVDALGHGSPGATPSVPHQVEA
jgi:AcrR family transcriptional regulator